MDIVLFRWRRDMLEVKVNDRDLVDVIADVERPFATADGQPDLAGRYAGLRRYCIRTADLREHLLGGPDSHLFCGPKDRMVLLGCECGEAGCWPLMSRVSVTGQAVTWSDFMQPYRKTWPYGNFQLAFDRAQYEAAIAAIQDP